MRKIYRKNSYKYLAAICQLIGLANCSPLCTLIFRIILADDLSDLQAINYVLATIMFATGIVFLCIGWYIMYVLDVSVYALNSKRK